MSCKVRVLLGAWMLGLALSVVVGCGPKREPVPPASDAVTTEPVDIQMPGDSKSGTAGAASSEAKTAEPTQEKPQAPKTP